jgi:hypothetical protein
MARLVDAIWASDFIVCHNAKFELGWLSRCGLDTSRVLCWCTQIAEYVYLSNRKGAINLDDTLARHGLEGKKKLISILLKGGICPSEVPKSLLIKYNKQDVEQTHRLFLLQREKYRNLLPVISTRCYSVPMLTSLECTGLRLTDECLTLSSVATQELEKLGRDFTQITNGVNFNSPDQVCNFVYDVLKFDEPIDPKTREPFKTKKGKRTANKDVLALLRPKTAEQRTFKELQAKLAKCETDKVFLGKLADCYNNNDGILHFNYNNTVVNTGRLSSQGGIFKIQGQNIPRKYKRLFGPSKLGNLIGELDYPNLEWRVAGHYGRDTRLLSDVLSGFDVHKFSASVFGISRQAAKAETFRPLFGSKGSTPKQRKYAIAFRERWSGVDRIQRAWAQHCLNTGEVVTETGWKFYWPAKLTHNGYIEYTTKIYDYPIQYLAGAELTMMACLIMWYLGSSMDSFMVNTVHDSNIWEVVPNEAEDWRQLGLDCFTTHVYNYMLHQYGISFFIPLGADSKVGPLWSVGEERKIDVTVDGKILEVRR